VENTHREASITIELWLNLDIECNFGERDQAIAIKEGLRVVFWTSKPGTLSNHLRPILNQSSVEYPGDPSFWSYPDAKADPGFHRARLQISKHLSPLRHSEGDYTSLRSIQASGGTKSTSVKSRIHQDPHCAKLCAGPALATS
jgi:hypothetical protein